MFIGEIVEGIVIFVGENVVRINFRDSFPFGFLQILKSQCLLKRKIPVCEFEFIEIKIVD